MNAQCLRLHDLPRLDLPRWVGLLLVAVLASVLATACAGPSSEIEVGAPIPAFALTSLDGDTVRSENLTGQRTVVSFWATWCQPCLHEIPLLKELHDDPTVNLLTIALDEGGRDVVAPFVEDRDLPYPVLLGDERVFQRMGGLAIPHTLILDGEGRVLDIVRGRLKRERIDQAFAANTF